MVGRVTTFKNWSLYHLGNSCETEVHVWIAKHAFEILASNQPTKQANTVGKQRALSHVSMFVVVLCTSSERPARDRIHIVGEGFIYVRHFVYIMHDDNNKTKKHPFFNSS